MSNPQQEASAAGSSAWLSSPFLGKELGFVLWGTEALMSKGCFW